MSKKRIHNLDTLDKEILRLQLRQKEQELRMRKNIDELKGRGALRILGTVLFGKKSEEPGRHRVSAFFEKLGDSLTDRFAGRIEDIIERIFSRKSK